VIKGVVTTVPKPCDDGLFSDEGKQLKLAIPADLSIPEFLRRAA
jgi:hypothetical protein